MQFTDDTNHKNEFQGTMRFAPLDADKLAARCATDANGAHKIVLTHCDQLAPTTGAALYFNGPNRTAIETESVVVIS